MRYFTFFNNDAPNYHHKLSAITESRNIKFYKGITDKTGLEKWPSKQEGTKGKIIPGFLSSYYIANIYSEPDLTGSLSGMIAVFDINSELIIDRSNEFIKWCDKNNKDYDISLGFPEEWRHDGTIWTVKDSGSAHAGVSCYDNASFVYCGTSVIYKVVKFFQSQEDWNRHFKTLRQ